MKNILRNMKLRTKAMLGFSIVFLIMLLSAMLGVTGLINNINKFSSFSLLAEQGQLADEIDACIYAERLTFKEFQASGNNKLVDQYDVLNVKLEKAVERLAEISRDTDRTVYISQIKEKNQTYHDNFDEYVTLYHTVSQNYTDLGAVGNKITNTVETIIEHARKNNNILSSETASDALSHLLVARLRVTKHYNSHSQADYKVFLDEFGKFEEGAKRLKEINTDAGLGMELFSLLEDISTYRPGIAQNTENIIRLDKISASMDSTGPEISALTSKIKESALKAISVFKNQVPIENQRSLTGIGLIYIAAIIFGCVVIFWIVRIILYPVNVLTETFESISAGEANTDFRLSDRYKDEIGQMSRAFNIFMIKIKEMIENIQYQNLLKSMEMDISEMARTEDDPAAVSDEIVHYLCEKLNMPMGAFYIPDNAGSFRLAASHAYTGGRGAGEKAGSGLGILGQVIRDRKMTVLENIPDDYLLIQSGLGEAKPGCIAVLPCMDREELEGIIELAGFERLREKQLGILEDLAAVIGRVLSSVKVRGRMKALLGKTLAQAEALQQQQEELHQSNEELEEQARTLKESESRLQQQQEELRVTNEELESYSRQLEEQKRILNEQNLALIEAREEMEQKAEALEKAHRYKSEFLANMSHELRTPLNSIIVLSELLVSRSSTEPLSEKEKEFAGTIHSSGKDLLALINGVLDLSKAEAGKMQILYEKVYLKDIIAENRNMFELMAGMKGLNFSITMAEGLPEYVVTDSQRLSQILKNLIANALKFTHEGSVNVRIRSLKGYELELPQAMPPEEFIAVEVSDTGIGIPKDKLQDVFEAFRQSDGTTSRQYGGTGLGLTISLELARLLGGDILLESEENRGSRFILLLPVSEAEERKESAILDAYEALDNYDSAEEALAQSAAAAPDGAEEKAAEETKASRPEEDGTSSEREKRILIIEDDPRFAQILANLSTEKGYAVSIAFNGKEGIRKAKAELPIGIILDIGLPDMDGLMLAELLSEDEATKNIPIHVISGSEEVAGEAGPAYAPKSIIGFLKKPVDIKSIYRTLAKIESLDAKGLKKLLVVGPCGNEDFMKFSQLGKVQVKKVMTGQEAILELQTGDYACIILDIKLSDTSGVDFMIRLRQELNINTPIIIYTNEEIHPEEIDDINRYAETIILKSPKSRERLMEEVSLFLYDVRESLTDHHRLEKAASGGRGSLADVRILLVDDDSRNVFALMHLLEHNGMRVTVAKDGYEAVRQFEQNDIDLVLMDIMMPKMDGYEAIRRIRETPRGRKVPVIALTAKAMSDDRDKCISAGANDYLTKPVDAGRLLSMMKVWLS